MRVVVSLVLVNDSFSSVPNIPFTMKLKTFLFLVYGINDSSWITKSGFRRRSFGILIGEIFLSRSTINALGTSRDLGTSIILGSKEFKHCFAMSNAFSSYLVKLCFVTQMPERID